MKPVVLRAESPGASDRAAFVEAIFLPGRGMDLIKVRGRVPGLSEVDLLHSPSLEEVSAELNGGPDDFMGVHSFRFGGALLVPFANRIRGRVSSDGRSLDTEILGHRVRLPADWQGKHAGAEKCAIHGLILAAKLRVTSVSADHVVARLDAGDFGGYWLSESEIEVRATLRWDMLHLSVSVENTGRDLLPIGIGWHPYFALPSGRRNEARLRLPATLRALVNNYDDVFPTGEVVPVAGTPYDFNGTDGAPLGDRYYDDCFLGLVKSAEKHVAIEVLDAAAHYGFRITGTSPHIRAIQIYSPPDKPFVVVEPQFNLADPFSEVWPKGFDTGMVLLGPGQSTAWSVEWRIFTV
jgi:aldose 1-epimerase